MVLKEKYFKHVNVMKARVKGNVSMMWISIISFRKVIKAGAHWPLGNCESIKIWKGKGLPTLATFQAWSPHQPVGQECFGEGSILG